MTLTLAPLAGYTDKAFRMIASAFGAQETVTEMVSAEGLARKSVKTRALMEKFDESENLTLQLFGPDGDTFKRALKEFRWQKFSKIDINAGCPVAKVVKTGAGSALMRKPEIAGEIIHIIKEETGLKVSIKFRLGWDEGSINYLDFAETAVKSGADELTLHARTRSQLYSGQARKEHFTALRALFPKNESTSPLLNASGDVFSAEDARLYLEEYGMDGVMFARGAIGNPFIFRETRKLLETGAYTLPSTEERIGTALRHLELAISFYGEQTAAREMRKVMMAYVKGIRNSSQIKAMMTTATCYQDYENALKLLAL